MGQQTEKEKNYEALFKTHYKQLFYYALRYVNDTENAADITNDVFCYIWEKYDQFTWNDSPLPLLYTLTRNFCVNYLRKKETEQKKINLLLLSDIYTDSIVETIRQEQKIRQIMENIQQLPPQTHHIFNECFMKGKNYKEVADKNQISINTVKTHVKRALSLLRKKNNE